MKKAFYLPILFLLLCSLTQAQTVFKAQVSNNPGIRADQLATPPIGWFVADGQAANFDGTMPEWTPSIGAASFLQSDPTKQPILKEDALNGHKVVYFDNTDDAMTSTISLGAGATTMIVVYNLLDNDPHTALQGTTTDWFVGSTDRKYGANNGGASAFTGNAVITGHYAIATFVTFGVFVSSDFYQDGTHQFHSQAVTATLGNPNLGAAGYNPALTLNGNIAEVILCDYALSSDEIRGIHDGLATYYGLTIDDSIIINNTIVQAELSDGAVIASVGVSSALLPSTTVTPIDAATASLTIKTINNIPLEVYDQDSNLITQIDATGAVDSTQGFQYNHGAATGTMLIGSSNYYISSTSTWPNTTTINRILFSSAANTIGEITTANSGVLVTSAGGVPSIAADIPTAVTIGTSYIYRVGGTDTSIADGGTGQSTATLGFNALSPVTTRGDIIVRDASNNVRLALGSTGKILRSNGTDLAYSTTTWPNTTTANRILYSSGTSVVGEITTANSAMLVTDSGGAPSISTDIPTAVTIGTAYIYRVGGTDVAITDGGTGQSTATLGFNALSPVTTRGDIIVRDASNNVRLALGSAGKIPRSDGTDLLYSTSTYPDTVAINRILYASSANVIGSIATANSGVLITDSGGIPSIAATLPTGNLPAVVDIATGFRIGGTAATGTILRGNGTNFIASTATYPNTTTVNRILYSSSTSVVGEITTANSGVLVTDGSGVPSISTDLPAAVTIGGTAITTAASTTTFTNKTLDVEATGNTVTVTDEIWRQAATMTATATAVFGDFNWTDLATAPTPTAINQSNIDLGHLVYSASATNSAVTYYRLPLSWTGNIDIEIIWSSSVGTNAVKWDVATAFGTASNPAFNTSQTVTTTVAGADTDTVSTITGLTTTGAVAGDMMYIKVSRLGADGADTCTGTARLIGVTIKIRRAL